MSCLHLVSLRADQPAALAQLHSLLQSTDAILLLGDGLALAAHFNSSALPVYRWDADLAQGLDDDAVVALTLTFDKTMSWHD